MQTSIAILLSLFCVLANSSPLSHYDGRIVGGSDAKRGQFPYMVSVQRNNGLWCGGTIISKEWVISAAHCYENPDFQKNLTAVAGLLHFDENHPDVQNIPIVQVINHPGYIHILELVDNDIALLRLKHPLEFTNAVQPAEIPPRKEQPTGNAWFSGWGIYKKPSTEPSTLQCLEMPLITKEECEYLFTKVPQPYQLLDTMVCVKPPVKAETGCPGDSGGPLVKDNTLVGITSWGSLECGLEVSATFSPLSSHNGRIIGGSDANRRQFPYMVSVQRNNGLWCGGTIISKDWVVSAAHCYETSDLQENLTAVAGLLHFGEDHLDVQNIPIVQVINHPKYIHIEDIIDNDISLLRLKYPLEFTNAVQPANLPPLEEQPTGNAWMTGWGIYKLPSTEPSTLQCLEMPIITKKECEYLFTKVVQPYELLDTMVCVKPPVKIESGCFGDSGGPLVTNNTLNVRRRCSFQHVISVFWGWHERVRVDLLSGLMPSSVKQSGEMNPTL
ncbi:hypothetical protein ILUMI_27516 [Ignelater luminosus]|uniref:Peptidase S1 domain-containing protein n=1 Tax=Ignelater luminosus TaxID=2038154 RepID=A0A8K0C4V4_IGNLU|nr:hypothetical protein ILUMI_27516 [Ignelater luminosus]